MTGANFHQNTTVRFSSDKGQCKLRKALINGTAFPLLSLDTQLHTCKNMSQRPLLYKTRSLECLDKVWFIQAKLCNGFSYRFQLHFFFVKNMLYNSTSKMQKLRQCLFVTIKIFSLYKVSFNARYSKCKDIP